MTAPYYADEDVTLFLGDCLDVLRAMEPDSVDAVVTDPPYGLEFMGREWDAPWKPEGRGGNTAGFAPVAYPDGAKRLDRPSYLGSPNPTCRNCGGCQRGREGRAVRKCVCEQPEFPNVTLPRMRAFQTWCEAWAAECLRVLKPGGYLLAFGGTRTWHRLVCGIEDAGFEVRDAVADLTGYDAPGLMWIQGSGFPKSRDVSKDLTGQCCTCRPVPYVHESAAEPQAEYDMPGLLPGDVPSAMAALAGQGPVLFPRVPEQGAPADGPAAVDGYADGAESRLEGRRDVFQDARELHRSPLRPGAGMGAADGAGGRLHHGAQARDGSVGRAHAVADGSGQPQGPQPVEQCAAEPGAVADERGSQAWRGWPVCGRCGKPSVPSGLGTALKPGWEPVAVGRKPLGGTVAGNVVEWGTGALNIDGCRVAAGQDYADKCASVVGLDSNRNGDAYGEWTGVRADSAHAAGRWPPNVVLGPAAAAELDRQSGVLQTHGGGTRTGARASNGWGMGEQPDVVPGFGGDTGGASRFFPVFRYEAKAAASERPRAEDGTAHPTVKPVDLMRWLVRLVTPPGGTVADFFAGSGTTGEACIVEGFKCVLAEKDPASAELIKTRLRKPIQPVMFGDVS